jgi:hypothetical protein
VFKAIIVKTIYDAPKAEQPLKFATLSQEIELPFPPILDIEISLGAIGSTRLKRIIWQHKSQRFLCDLIDDFAKSIDGRTTEFQDLLDYAYKDGWKLISVDDVNPDFFDN